MISIIVTLHNKENTIVSALQSLVAQTAQKWEAVIIDNASTDDSEHQVRSYLIDRRMRYVRLDKEVSIEQARAKGLEQTTGEWVLFLDGGDYLEPTALEALYLSVKKYGTLIGVGNYSVIRNGEKVPRYYRQEGKISSKKVSKGAINVVTGGAILHREIAGKHEIWKSLDVAYTDHLVVINGESEEPLIAAFDKLAFLKRFIPWVIINVLIIGISI